MGSKPRRQCADAILFARVGGQRDDRDARIGFADRFKLPKQRVAVRVGHADVGDHDLGHVLMDCAQRLGHRRGRHDARARGRQEARDQFARVRFVVDDQDRSILQHGQQFAEIVVLPFGFTWLGRCGAEWQLYRERRPFAETSALDADVAAVHSMRWRTMANPRPRPPCTRVEELSACLNRSNTCGRNAGSMP